MKTMNCLQSWIFNFYRTDGLTFGIASNFQDQERNLGHRFYFKFKFRYSYIGGVIEMYHTDLQRSKYLNTYVV